MSAPTENLLAPGSPITLENCDREPIHTPGAIQPHGALIVVNGPWREVVQRSADAGERLGVTGELIGRTLDELVGAEAAAALTRTGASIENANLRPRTVEIGGERFDAFGYSVGSELTVVELEPAGATASAEAVAEDVAGLLVALQSAESSQALLESAAGWVAELTGFDRVWVYRFEEDDHGVVVVEERRADLDPFLGLHFPARDIPVQARALFLANRVRFIPDALSDGTPLHPVVNPVSGEWLDLSAGVLRAVSPMHLQYLRNMGATASMSIALEVDGRLWGLISGHHYSGPRVVEHRLRLACEILGRVVSSQLTALLGQEASRRRVGLDVHREAVLASLAGGGELADSLIDAGPALLELCGADGAAVVIGDRVTRLGRTPEAEAIRGLLGALPAGEEIFLSSALSRDLGETPRLGESLTPACGAMVLALTRAGGADLVWFRDEYVRSVTWGDSGLAPPRDRLHPTGSYATWSESVRGESRPWSREDRDAALSLRAGIGTVVLEQAEALARANRELERSNGDLEAFTFIVAHDLREPLRNMQSFLGFFLEDHGTGLDPEGLEQLETIARLGVRMDGLMDSLLSHARADRLSPTLVSVALGDIVADAKAMLGPLSTRGEIVVHHPETVLSVDREAMMHILINLISNAMKYSPQATPRVEIDVRREPPSDESGPERMVVSVRDYGIGVAVEHHDAVFDLFRRLHARDAYGGGSGAGLAIARRLAQRQGGELWLENSAPDDGSVFSFTVPGE